MLWLLLGGGLVAAIVGPQMWAQHVLRRHGEPRTDLPGTGGELARHLIGRLDLDGVALVRSERGDHYDPMARQVGLSKEVFDGRSLTAVVVAAHEVGHALQHRLAYRPLLLRPRLARIAAWAEKFGALVLVSIPVFSMVTRMPAVGAIQLLAGLAILVLPVVLHLVTLPVEFDASFRRALPLLASGYLEARDLPAARRILRACALTYVAASLATLLNFWRWIRILRR